MYVLVATKKDRMLPLTEEEYKAIYACPCADCGVETSHREALKEYYVVTDEIWNTVGAGEGYLCIGCLEERLGRKLVPEDFPPYPVNVSPKYGRSERLQNRLGDIVARHNHF